MPINRVILDEKGIRACTEEIQTGNLVAFPTETVYGLGCDARNAEACKSVYALKGRPHTDPLIVHVPSFDDACDIWNLADSDTNHTTAFIAKRILQRIADAFWPGPLTMIYEASPFYAESPVSAGTGLVGVRIPSHPTARKLLEFSKIPIAAPSANRFGHTSPTTTQHVIDDFCDTIEKTGGMLTVVDTESDMPCDVGIESTILRLSVKESQDCGLEARIELLRKGMLTQQAIRAIFEKSSAFDEFSMDVEGSNVKITIEAVTKHITNIEEKQSGPGQLIKHYAPSIPTYLLKIPPFLQQPNIRDLEAKGVTLKPHSGELLLLDETLFFWIRMEIDGDWDLDLRKRGPDDDCFYFKLGLKFFVSMNSLVYPAMLPPDYVEAQIVTHESSIACIDYNGQLAAMGGVFHHYQDLSSTGDPQEAAQGLYAALRYAESGVGASRLFVPDVRDSSAASDSKREMEGSIADRLFRSASGVSVRVLFSLV